MASVTVNEKLKLKKKNKSSKSLTQLDSKAEKKTKNQTKVKLTKKKMVENSKSVSSVNGHLTDSHFHLSYSPAPESTKVKLKDNYELFINGKFKKPESGKYLKSINPSNEKTLAEIPQADLKDVNLAVESAKAAYDNHWSKLSGLQRSKYLFRIARLIQEKSRELAVLESMDNGKPIKESRDFDLPQVAANFFYFAGWADKIDYLAKKNSYKSIGVAGQIIPWNFPLLMAAWKIAPALAAGNCVVLKPAETTSLTALHLAEIIQEADLPPGVVNIITGDGETGSALVNHHLVNKIAFTGSTEVGKLINTMVAGTGKKLTLELGGKSAHIVFADAAIDQAVEGVVNGIFFNQGHVCCAGSRLLLEESISDIFLKKLKRRMQSLIVGDPLDKNTDIGAINSKNEIIKIKALIEQGKKEGGSYFQSSAKVPDKGYFLQPCLFENVSSSSSLSRLEIFGPVLSVMTFRTPDEAVLKANDTNYGLAAGIWSEKGSKVHQVAGKLKAGVIWINTYNKFDPSSPFGGYFESGMGREGGKQGLLSYLELN